MRRILHLDMDAFFAAVELKKHPELKGRPIIVGGEGDPTKRGVVSTTSYEARKFGIHSAMPLRTAYKLCPSAVFLPVDYREYSKESKKVKDILRGFSPIIEMENKKEIKKPEVSFNNIRIIYTQKHRNSLYAFS